MYPLRLSHRLLWAIGFCLIASSGAAQTPAPEAPEDQSWWERTTFSGDFRSRYEGFYQEGRARRHRYRLRLRLRLDTQLNEATRFQLRVASGDPGTPVSTNQTFTEFFLPKPFNLDRAFVVYSPTEAKALTLGGGKFAFPVTRTQMVWDDDLNWEGGYEQVAWSGPAGMSVKLVALQTAVTEIRGQDDSFMLAGYGELGFSLGRHALQFSLANYGFGRVDQVAIGSVTGPLRSSNTNLLERNDLGNVIGFASDFNLVDIIGQATLATSRPDYPIRLLANWVTNTRAATDEKTGIWFEAEIGRAARPKTFAFGYTYGWIERDAVLSPFMFSDIPGSNLRLNMIDISYMPLPRLNIDLTLHLTKQLVVPEGALNTLLLRPHFAFRVGF